MSPSMSTQGQLLLARQPIFDRNQRVIAYELLYRSDELETLIRKDGDTGHSSAMIIEAYTSISDEGEVKRVPALLSLSSRVILEEQIPSLPKKQVLIEVSIADAPRETVARALKALSHSGYRSALNLDTYKTEYDPLIRLADIAKISVRGLDKDQIRQITNHIKTLKTTLMAAEIDDYNQLELCIECDFKLFQGNFLSKPRLVKGQKIKANHVALMQLIQELQKPTASPEKLEMMIIRDPALTYKLLRVVNSAAYSLVRKVESVAQAVVLLGLEQIKKWSTLIALDSHKEKPEELTRILLVRGRMCELIAMEMKLPNPSSYLIAGLMSGIHLLLDMEQETLLQQVPLGDEIMLGIQSHEGDIGKVLKQVMAYESGDWDNLPPDFDAGLYEIAYRESLKWTKESMQVMYENT